MKKPAIIIASIFVILSIVAYTQLTLFVIQPIGAIPEGKTLIIARMNKTEFIDSADAMCEREMGGVSLICRITMIGGVLNKTNIFARLPYSEWLYNISTDGHSYEH